MWLLLACQSSPDTAQEPVPANVTEGGVVPCRDPSARVEKGPFVQSSLGDSWNAQPWQGDADSQFASGSLVAADFNGDGRPDLFVPHVRGHRLYLSLPNGTWTEGVLPDLPDLVVGGAAADFDGDGDPDLFVTVLHGPNHLLENRAGVWVEVTLEQGLGGPSEDTTSALWADIDDDGDLDLLVSNHRESETIPEEMLSGSMEPAHSNRAWRNDEGAFVELTEDFPDAWRYAFTFVTAWEDFDGDGRSDLYMANDFGPFATPNGLFLEGTQLQSGTGLEVAAYSMGLAIGELNGDGVPDLFVTSWEDVVLLLSDGAGGWYRAESAMGLTLRPDQHASWGTHFADFDNDGDQDLVAAFGELWMGDEAGQVMEDNFGLTNPKGQTDGAWRNDGGTFTDVAAEWGLDQDGRGRSVEPIDLNQDGWLDLVKRNQDGPAVVLMARCGEQTWLSVTLEQPGPNPDAIGATVRVGDQTRVVRAGGQGAGGSLPPSAHFGLGEQDRVDVEITWPSGETTQVLDLATRQHVRVRP